MTLYKITFSKGGSDGRGFYVAAPDIREAFRSFVHTQLELIPEVERIEIRMVSPELRLSPSLEMRDL